MSQAKDRSIFTITAAHSKVMRRRLLRNSAPDAPLLTRNLTYNVTWPPAPFFEADILNRRLMLGEINLINSPLLRFSPTSPCDLSQLLQSPVTSLTFESPTFNSSASLDGNADPLADTSRCSENI